MPIYKVAGRGRNDEAGKARYTTDQGSVASQDTINLVKLAPKVVTAVAGAIAPGIGAVAVKALLMADRAFAAKDVGQATIPKQQVVNGGIVSTGGPRLTPGGGYDNPDATVGVSNGQPVSYQDVSSSYSIGGGGEPYQDTPVDLPIQHSQLVSKKPMGKLGDNLSGDLTDIGNSINGLENLLTDLGINGGPVTNNRTLTSYGQGIDSTLENNYYNPPVNDVMFDTYNANAGPSLFTIILIAAAAYVLKKLRVF